MIYGPHKTTWRASRAGFALACVVGHQGARHLRRLKLAQRSARRRERADRRLSFFARDIRKLT